MDSKEYWNKKIIDWESSSYSDASKNLSLIEKLATRFRGPIKKRKEVMLDMLGMTVKGKTILELGCGSGRLCFELLERGAAKVIGMDISEEAIRLAKENADKMRLKEKVEFRVANLRENGELPEADFVVGLGFIDYIDKKSLKRILSKIKGKFIFSFPEKRINLINILHFLYLKSQGCDSFYKFKRSDFKECKFFTRDKMLFIAKL